jgi:hypothetical protein
MSPKRTAKAAAALYALISRGTSRSPTCSDAGSLAQCHLPYGRAHYPDRGSSEPPSDQNQKEAEHERGERQQQDGYTELGEGHVAQR